MFRWFPSALVLSTCIVFSSPRAPAQQAVAKEPATASRPATAPESRPELGKLQWPRDEQRVIATVDGEPLTLKALVTHIDERHAPGWSRLLVEPGMLDLQSAKAPIWVRTFADLTALQAEARSRAFEQGTLTQKSIEEHLALALKSAFEQSLEAYQKANGGTQNLTQERINQLLAHFQKDSGLETEVQGYLDALVPEAVTEGQLYDFYTREARAFGGLMAFAHILVHHRDPVTGELLSQAQQKRAHDLIDDLRSRLLPDGSNFEEIAKRYSEDRMTAKRGGLFENVARLDPRLPAALVRPAWMLRDGAWDGPIETPFGLHLIKKISCVQERFVIYTEQIKPQIRADMRKMKQEDLLFAVRAKRRVKLFY